MLALGDALAIAVSLRRGFRAEDFAALHPGGKLGKRLATVRQLMHTGDAVPRVDGKTPMTDVIYEMSRKKLGMTTVEHSGKLAGIISDGDLRRLLERDGPDGLRKTAAAAMNLSKNVSATRPGSLPEGTSSPIRATVTPTPAARTGRVVTSGTTPAAWHARPR